MKCQRCQKAATFHITELAGSEPQELHFCEECTREYLAQSEIQEDQTMLNALAQAQIKVGQTAEELARLDQQACPVCGITFYEFRHIGRLGCPHDYVCFEQDLEPLIVNIHGETTHEGKVPKGGMPTADEQTELIRLRREMQDAIDQEDYEAASELRDRIKTIEQGKSK